MDYLKNISWEVLHGLFDSLKGITVVFYIDRQINLLSAQKEAELREKLAAFASTTATLSSRDVHLANKYANMLEEIVKSSSKWKIARKVFKCCALNGGFTWLSIIIFECIILPGLEFAITWCYGEKNDELKYVWGWLQSLLSILFGMMWVLPIFLLSKVVSSLWFQDIANEAYRFRKGRPQMITSISKLIADFLFSIFVQALFLAQSMLVNNLPIKYVGTVLCFIHLCLLYSLYSFEYKWFNMGWELHKRLLYIENNWPYFLGFGIPLTVLTSFTNSVIVSSCIFSIFFPLFILSGNEASPVLSKTFPLKLFSPVVLLSNFFFTRSVRVNRTLTASSKAQMHPSRHNSTSSTSNTSDRSSRSRSRPPSAQHPPNYFHR